MVKKIRFNDDGSQTTIHREHSDFLEGASGLPRLGGNKELSAEQEEELVAKKQEKRKRKFERLVAVENEYLKKKYCSSAADSVKTVVVTAQEPSIGDSGDGIRNSPKKDLDLEKDHNEKEKEEDEAPAISKAKTAALDYLTVFTLDKSKWKFQKVRQIWLLQNMYFSKQMDNDQFKDLLAYLKGMSDKQRKITVQEAKNILESADPISDTTKKRAKKIIKLL